MNGPSSLFFFFNDTATTEIYTLSLHDALPISFGICIVIQEQVHAQMVAFTIDELQQRRARSEEHTSELQSQSNLVCRLLLEKKTYDDARRLPSVHRQLLGSGCQFRGAQPLGRS